MTKVIEMPEKENGTIKAIGLKYEGENLIIIPGVITDRNEKEKIIEAVEKELNNE